MKRFLALTAVVFLLLRPLCEVQAAEFVHDGPGSHAHASASHHSDDTALCCAELEDGTLTAPSAAAPALGDGKGAFTAPVLSVVHAGGAPGTAARHPPSFLFPSLSFYARSARIRR
jgi:hypothetical protein